MAASCVVLRRFCNQLLRQQGPRVCSLRGRTTGNKDEGTTEQGFDSKLLDILVCPLSKKPLRYDSVSNELISDDLGVAYTIENGIPNLVPSDGRLLNAKNNNTDK